MALGGAVPKDSRVRRPRLNPNPDGPRVFVAFGRDSRDQLRVEVEGTVPDERAAALRDEVARLFEMTFGQ